MSRFWSPLVHDLKPYVAGEQPVMRDIVKLNTNENPYGPSPRALDAIRAAAADTLRLYPEPTSHNLRETIARREGVQAAQVFVGNSSDEVLALVFQALLKHERPLAFPDVTYSFYPVWSQLFGVSTKIVPLDADMRIAIADYGEMDLAVAAQTCPCGGLYTVRGEGPGSTPGRRVAHLECRRCEREAWMYFDVSQVRH